MKKKCSWQYAITDVQSTSKKLQKLQHIVNVLIKKKNLGLAYYWTTTRTNYINRLNSQNPMHCIQGDTKKGTTFYTGKYEEKYIAFWHLWHFYRAINIKVPFTFHLQKALNAKGAADAKTQDNLSSYFYL